MAGLISKSLPFSSQGYFLLAGDLKLPVDAATSANRVLFALKETRGKLRADEPSLMPGKFVIQIPDINKHIVADQHEVVGNFTYQMPDSSSSIYADQHEVVGKFTYQMPDSSSSIYADRHEVIYSEDNYARFNLAEVDISGNLFGE